MAVLLIGHGPGEVSPSPVMRRQIPSLVAYVEYVHLGVGSDLQL